MTATQLNSRAIVRLSTTDDGEDVRTFLQGLITNDVSGELPVYAALLSAQGKTMFDFLVWEGGDGTVLLDCEAQYADELVKRLSLYRLRRKIEISRDEDHAAHWSPARVEGSKPDPRLPEMGHRWIAAPAGENADDAYRAHRLSCGVPETRAEMGDILWLETNAVELNGVSFEKGCYIGQENTARMNWRNKVNRRLVVVDLERSDEARRKRAYPDLGKAIDHLRVGDLDPGTLPEWQARAIAETD